MAKHSIKVLDCDLHLTNLQTRMPFKYGIATMTRVPHGFVRVRAEVEGKPSIGIAADLLPPKWFTKDPDKPVIDEVLDMMRVIRHAADAAKSLSGSSTFDVWQQLYRVQDAWGAQEKLAPLLTHFGTSLVERALIEAACRAYNTPFAEALRTNRLGVRLGDIHVSLQNRAPSDFLAAKPLDEVILRHTVGLVDPLVDQHIAAGSKLNDGLPQSLAACIKAYDLRHFKIKVTGHLDHDLDRLDQIARVLEVEAKPDYRFSLDGNEQFKSLTDFRSFWQAVIGSATLREFLKHLLFVEQPLHRDQALQAAARELFSGWPERPSIIIDESDGTLESLPMALNLGYAGTSHKNCKGIFKGIANRCLLKQMERARPGSTYIMSGEDLCTIGPVSVLQDLTVMAALGIQSVERNGHHYFPGLSIFSKEIQAQVLGAHPDLYRLTGSGWPALDIEDGTVKVRSLNAQPFGAGFEVDVGKFTPAGEFRPQV
ncbi:MAG: hypothetical protein FJ403_08010 [Verrucomicrobia bacterium]|nr:hypothetical protein [Verrucomicrobiota bacterium]